MVDLLLAFILAHLLADFVLQTDKSCQKKSDSVLKRKVVAHLGHIAVYALVNASIFALMRLFSWPNLLALGLLTVTHGVVDFLKSSIAKGIGEFLALVVDQSLHIASIIVAVAALYPGELSKFFAQLLFELKTLQTAAGIFSTEQKLLLAAGMLIVVTAGANVLVRAALRSLNIQMTFHKSTAAAEKDDAVKTGRYIGAIERVLTVFALLAGSYQSIVALYAAKTAVRFKQVSDDFQEYYILGTLLSLLIGIVSGAVLKVVL